MSEHPSPKQEAKAVRPSLPNPYKRGKKAIIVAYPIKATGEYICAAENYMDRLEVRLRGQDDNPAVPLVTAPEVKAAPAAQAELCRKPLPIGGCWKSFFRLRIHSHLDCISS
jgi:hypothetical protein